MNEPYEIDGCEPCEHTALRAYTRGPLSPTGLPQPTTIGELVSSLSAMYPPADAEPWDRTGLLVGDPAAQLEGVAVALDPTVEAVREAARAHANVLLTHHPAFLEPPTVVSPSLRLACAQAEFSMAGAVVYEAVRCGVALVNYHTALDVSADAQDMLPGMLRLARVGVLEPLAHDDGRGYGQVCTIPADQRPLVASSLAARCTAVFGRTPRLWGAADHAIESVVTWTGSAGDAPARCLARGVDALVCGEVKYHAALEASCAGLTIIELGHDVSELPFANVLARAASRAGVPREMISCIRTRDAWTHPESRRA